MNWDKLLTPNRLYCPKDDYNYEKGRNEFQKDYDRIVFSTFFRRLQGKTQVFPFPHTDTIHTRLTHSLEASSVGRSLGAIVGLALKEREKKIDENLLGRLVSVACLAHDIGNPPLGHSGEAAISEYFNSERGQEIIKDLTDEQKTDFTKFDGNALGFHFLTHSNKKVKDNKGGLSLTLPALATYCKYPTLSIYSDNKSEKASEKKPGLFTSDINVYVEEIANTLGIKEKITKNNNGEEVVSGWHRHPLAFLNEAADDICNAISDFEDGYKHNMIKESDIEEHFRTIINDHPNKNGELNTNTFHNPPDKIGYLRAKAINSLVHQAATVFLNNEKSILNCSFDKPIFDFIDSKSTVDTILKESKKRIYSYKTVLQVETAGFQVLSGLLDKFIYAIRDVGLNEDKAKASTKKLLKLIPEIYIHNFKDNQYESILCILGYIAGMTDNFAVDTYRNISGIQLPNY